MRFTSLLLLTAFVWGCDAADDTDTTLTFQGEEVEARGAARLQADGTRLVVSNIGASGADGLLVRGDIQAFDLVTAPVRIPEGGAFGIRVEDAAGALVSGFQNVDRPGDDGHDFVVEYADALGVDAVSVSYEFAGQVLFRIPRLPLGTPKNGKRTTSAGSGSGDSGSVHTVRENGRYVVVSDSQPKAGCPGFLITPPPPFDQDAPDVLCADWVEVAPLTGERVSAIGGVAVVGRGLGSFTVTSLDAER